MWHFIYVSINKTFGKSISYFIYYVVRDINNEQIRNTYAINQSTFIYFA